MYLENSWAENWFLNLIFIKNEFVLTCLKNINKKWFRKKWLCLNVVYQNYFLGSERKRENMIVEKINFYLNPTCYEINIIFEAELIVEKINSYLLQHRSNLNLLWNQHELGGKIMWLMEGCQRRPLFVFVF